MAPWRAIPPSGPSDAGAGLGADSQAGTAPAVFPPDMHDGRHLLLKGLLLLVWALVSFGVCFFARDLQWTALGWPLGYWMASQGALLVFLAIVVVYAVAMSRFEREDGAQADAAAAFATDGAASAGASAAAPGQERGGG